MISYVMNSKPNYVISGQIDRLLLAPSRYRLLSLLLLALILSTFLIHQLIGGPWRESVELDNQLLKIDSQLAEYEQHRERINREYEQRMTELRLLTTLKRQFSRANTDHVESWLIRTAIDNQLQPSRIDMSTRLLDEQGEYFRATLQVSGTYRNIQSFLETTIRSDFVLVWEQLIFENFGSNRLGLKISMKQYTNIKVEHSDSS